MLASERTRFSLTATRWYWRWLPRLLAAVVVVELCLFLWPYVHRVLGGSEVPPPRWTEADLRPLPVDEDNAWYLIPSADRIPPFHPYASLLDEARIPSHLLDSADAVLRQPSVADLLYRGRAVRAKPTMASPQDLGQFMGDDDLRLLDWHYWVLLSARRRLGLEPSTVADELARQVPTWVACANSARSGLAYLVCAIQARRDLELAVELGTVLANKSARRRLADAIDNAPSLSPRNAFIAEYVRAYRGLESSRVHGKRTFLRRTDLKRTLEGIDRVFLAAMEGRECAETILEPWGYNWGGRVLAKILTTPMCSWAAKAFDVTEGVATLRAEALRALVEHGD